MFASADASLGLRSGYLPDIEVLRDSEFKHLRDSGVIYLDYTGSGLYQRSQLVKSSELLLSRVFANTHSPGACARSTDEAVVECRTRVLEFFGLFGEFCHFKGKVSPALLAASLELFSVRDIPRC